MAVLLASLAGQARADPPIVESAIATSDSGTWRFAVTLWHGDTGCDDYADGWRVVAPDGAVLGTRELLHPHVNEQPFTRSLSGILIPDGLSTVFIEARTNTDGWSATQFRVDLPN